ncbi:substrate-binding domain-containing protein [Streptomyces sp. NPDC050416]|uniref:substrate-binding domain-containing protein n=1 Tax=Streptomyces sp. NPDC050416 TaxID=3365611 RepID=UPI0037B9AB0A
MPTVAIDVERPQRLAPVLGLAQAPGARTVTEHLLALGHERVWHLAGPADWDSSHLRERGWREAHTGAGRTPPRVMRGDWTARSGYELGRRLAVRPEVTAVFAANDQMAIGALRALREAGRDVPRDVSLVGYDDVPESAYLWPPLTTVRQDFGAAGSRSLDLLVSQMRGAPRNPEVTLIGTELVVRESSAPPPPPPPPPPPRPGTG